MEMKPLTTTTTMQEKKKKRMKPMKSPSFVQGFPAVVAKGREEEERGKELRERSFTRSNMASC